MVDIVASTLGGFGKDINDSKKVKRKMVRSNCFVDYLELFFLNYCHN